MLADTEDTEYPVFRLKLEKLLSNIIISDATNLVGMIMLL